MLRQRKTPQLPSRSVLDGAVASLELRIPLFVDDTGQVRYGLRLVPFIDYGVGRDCLEGLSTAPAQTLLGGGVGLSWNGWSLLHAQVYYGQRFEGIPRQGDSLQEDGVHFDLAFR